MAENSIDDKCNNKAGLYVRSKHSIQKKQPCSTLRRAIASAFFCPPETAYCATRGMLWWPKLEKIVLEVNEEWKIKSLHPVVRFASQVANSSLEETAAAGGLISVLSGGNESSLMALLHEYSSVGTVAINWANGVANGGDDDEEDDADYDSAGESGARVEIVSRFSVF